MPQFTLPHDPTEMPKNGSLESGYSYSKKCTHYGPGGPTGSGGGSTSAGPDGTTDGPAGQRIKGFHGSPPAKAPAWKGGAQGGGKGDMTGDRKS